MKVFAILLILVSLGINVSFSHEVEVKMTIDLVNSFESTTDVTAFLCWDLRTKIGFIKQLMNLKRPATILFINERMRIEPATKYKMIVTDLTCPGIEEFLKKANKTNMFGSSYRWLIFGHQSNQSNIVPSQLKGFNILHDSEVIVAQKKAEGYFEFHLVYKLRTKQVWLTEYYGMWMSSLGLQKSSDIRSTTKTLRRRNLAREELSVTFNVDDVTTGSCSTKCDMKILNSIHSVSNWGFHQILPLYEFLNATRVNYFTDNWGYLVNGSWNGIVGALIRGDADLSGTPIFMAADRIPYLDYLSNAIRTSAKFVFREPPLSYQNNLFLLPFNKAVWWSLAAFVLLMMIVIYVNAKWEAKKLKISEDSKDVKTNDPKLTISDVAMMIIGAISQQGSAVELRGSIGRLVMFTLFLAFLFLFTAYSASIVALLQSSSKQIRTLSDLLNSRLELGVENMTYNVHYFTTAKDPVRKAIYETKVAPKGSKPNFMSLEEGIRKLQKHPFAFNMDIGVGYKLVEKYFYEHEKCGLQEIAYLSASKPWLTCRKASPYAEFFKIGMLRIHEHGMIDRVNRWVYSRKPVCLVNGASFDSVSIVDVYPSLLMLIYGMLLACALLAAEILFNRQRMDKVVNAKDEVIDTVN